MTWSRSTIRRIEIACPICDAGKSKSKCLTLQSNKSRRPRKAGAFAPTDIGVFGVSSQGCRAFGNSVIALAVADQKCCKGEPKECISTCLILIASLAVGSSPFAQRIFVRQPPSSS